MIRIVSTWAIVFSVITLFLSLIVPVLLAIWFVRKFGINFSVVIAGALTFIVFQMVLRIPLLQLLTMRFPGLVPNPQDAMALFIYTFFLSLSAALFEEGGRWLVYKYFVKKPANWQNAIGFGIGHGGIEAILLVGLTGIFNLLFLVLIKLDLNPFGGTMFYLLENSKAQLLQTPAYMFLLAGIERMLVIPAHVAFSVLVVLSLARKEGKYFILALLGHFLLNLPTMFMAFPYGLVVVYTYLAIAFVLAMLWIKRAKKYFPENTV
ncbi:MAG: YhfC family intramembrane metalloprotease [Firmicutes bacterium]|nr:YhfC family intramembrane metalloprotease [Bacillota bacterium]